MKNLILNFCFLFISIVMNAQTPTLFVGTYTSGASEGVYTFEFDSKTGQLSNKKLVVEETNPSYVAFTKNKQFLYVINEINNFDTSESGSVSTYALDAFGSYKKINTLSTHGAHPCHISLNDAEDRLAISNYSGGTVSLHNIHNGIIQPAFQVLNHNSEVQAHAHMAQFNGNQLIAADLGRNFIAEYTENKTQNYVSSKVYSMVKNAGPRHFRCTKGGEFMYVINELNSSISVLKKSDQGFSQIQNVPTLPEGYTDFNACADIHISVDEHYVYGSNRGENTIVVFKRNPETGRLKKVQSISVQGDWPRSFTIDPSGSFMLVANERSNGISVFKIDKNTGKLKFSYKLEMHAPVCLLF